jgi:hypothetical protein
MKKDTVYKLIIALLLALNLLQLATYLFAPQSQQPQKDKFQDVAIKILNLNEEQQQRFHHFAQEHGNKMMPLYKKQSLLTVQYFNQPSDSLLNLIAKLETKKIIATEQHFSEIKSILNQSQVANFEKFKKEALQNILEKNTSSSPPSPRND